MVGRVFPFLRWLRHYNKESAVRDFLAGLTVAVVLIPQSMAYAMLAGLPPVVGLYASAFAPAIAALWGSSPQLQTGPVAIVSLLVFTSLFSIAEPESEQFVQLAALLALLVGIFQLALGVFRLGFIMNFVSHAVVIGFSNAAAIIIASTQVPHLLGIEIEKHEFVFKNFLEIAKGIDDTHLYTALIGFLATIFILVSRKIHPLFPGALIVVVVSTLLSFYMGLEERGVKVVGHIPSGLPKPSLPDINLDILDKLMGQAIVIAIIGFMEAYAIAKTMAAQTKFKLDVDQELVGQGLANLVNTFVKGYPVSGSFSRSAVNFLAGAKTGMSSVFTSLFVIFTLFFFAPLLYNLPRAVLAAVVIVAVLGIVKPKAFLELYRTNPQDGIVAGVTFISAFIMKPDYAIFIGIVLSLILFLWRSMHPRIVVLTRDAKTRTFMNAELYGLPSCPQMLFVRPDASLYFANVEHIMEEVDHLLSKYRESIKFLVIDAESINYIDATAIDVLKEYIEEREGKGLKIYFVNLKTPVRSVLERAGVFEMIGQDRVLPSKGSAVSMLFEQIDHGYCKSECPYAVFEECYGVKEFVKLRPGDRELVRKLYQILGAKGDLSVFIGNKDSTLLVIHDRYPFEFRADDFFVDERGRVFIAPSKTFIVRGKILSVGQLSRKLGLQLLNGNPLLGNFHEEAAQNLIRLIEIAYEEG
jgi:SulP family sulfate permease